jgi:hypothetical protein
MLTNTPLNDRLDLLMAFARRVRQGHYGKGNQVTAGTVQVALRAIGATFELDARPNPTYRSEGKYWLPLQRLIEGYRRDDPPAQPKLAVPISVIKHLHDVATGSDSNKVQAVSDMSTIAFFYLLRVGEYTSHRQHEHRRTQQFRPCDITFWDKHDNVIPNTAPLEALYLATSATMRITNQKNGTKGDRISHSASGLLVCPVRALARRVHHIMSHPQCSATDIISTYYSPHAHRPLALQPGDINTAIKITVRAIGLDKKGFPPNSVSSHSLRAGGAMAMHLNNIPSATIRKQGR